MDNNIPEQSNYISTVGDVEVEEVSSDLDEGTMDLDMHIEIYWQYANELERLLKSTSGDFEANMQAFMEEYFNNGTADSIGFAVDVESIKTFSGSNTFIIFGAMLISIIIAMIL